jgi:hypothetical protein
MFTLEIMPADRRVEFDHRRWITRLAAFDPGDLGIDIDLLMRNDEHGKGTAGNAAADDGFFARQHLDVAEGEDEFLQTWSLLPRSISSWRFATAGLFEDDGVLRALAAAACRAEVADENEDQKCFMAMAPVAAS